MRRTVLCPMLAATAALVVAGGCQRTADDDDTTETHHCLDEGATTCQDDEWMVCADGVWVAQETCQDFCDPDLGCLLCPPGQPFCDGDAAMLCSEDGMDAALVMDCGEFHVECDEGECLFDDPCDEAEAWQSNIGCEYWAADLDNAENAIDDAAAGQFAVAVANIAGDGSAHVEVHINHADPGQGLELEKIDEADVAPGALHVFELPRRDVDGDDVTPNVDDGPQTWLSSRAFRITSDLPVVAYQFNTLDQQYSNDASLLLPTSGLGKDYRVVTYDPSTPMGEFMGLAMPANRGYVTILGVEDGTEVTVTVTADIRAGEGVPEISNGVGIYGGTSATFTINRFDVLNLETMLWDEYPTTQTGERVDLTGTRVEADEPVAVFTGTDMSMVLPSTAGEDSCCAEHIEQQVLPSRTMGSSFVVPRSAPRCPENPEPDYYRIFSYDYGTTVHTSLTSAGDDEFTLNPGQYHELWVTHGFTVEADGPLHVAQYLVVGTEACYSGDSALLYVPAVDQRRPLYVFTTGEGFATNQAVISMPEGVTAQLDGVDVSAPSCYGPLDDGTVDGVAYVSYSCEIADGVHTAYSGTDPDTATEPIGVFVYGYYNAGSYAYPAGSDLRTINELAPE